MNNLKNEFLLDKEIIFLNHGSFGATPRVVFDRYQYWQRRLEDQPVKFLAREAPQLLEAARIHLADYLGTQPENLVYVTNTTFGINVIARAMRLGPGDIVLSSNHEYGAMERTWRFLESQKGFKYHPIVIPTPLTDEESVVKLFTEAFSEKTKILFLSHIASPTSLILPVKEICKAARAQNIITIIDGAHAPGHIPLHLDELNVDFYVGNLHKWLCAPKGSAFLYAAPHRQHLVEPLIVSWGWQSESPGSSQFIDYLEWNGTRDISAFLSVPEAIHFQNENHWDNIRANCHQLASFTQKQISLLTNQNPLYPDDPTWFMQMGSSPLPAHVNPVKLKSQLYDEFKIEIPIIFWNGQILIRYSYQAYNDENDSLLLINALQSLLNQYARSS